MNPIPKRITPAVLVSLLLAAARAPAFYDPGLQRWINRDPLGEGGGINLTRYVLNNPVSGTDKFGKKPIFVPPMPPLGDPGAIVAACKCRNMVYNAMHGAEAYANAVYGGPGQTHANAGSLADMMTHCIGACLVARGEGACAGSGIDPRQYLQDREKNRDTDPEDTMDYENNRIGFGIADKAGDCIKGCEKAFADGLLWTMDPQPPHAAHPSGTPTGRASGGRSPR